MMSSDSEYQQIFHKVYLKKMVSMMELNSRLGNVLESDRKRRDFVIKHSMASFQHWSAAKASLARLPLSLLLEHIEV